VNAPSPQPSNGVAGAVVLPAYRPQAELFRRQLESIRDQSVTDFTCIIGSDGDPAIQAMVEESVGDDHRFRVTNHRENIGLYRNVERLLDELPAETQWVALSDQDDRWYPDKLERLIPHLNAASLVMGQAAVVDAEGRQCGAPTRRRHVPVEQLVLENEVTGSLCLFRRDLLHLALPFPKLNAPTQMHDHWLGVCAAATGGYAVLDDRVQDYVQHVGNLIGENLPQRRNPLRALREISAIADEYEGGHSPAQCARACRSLSFGWRRAMVGALMDRLEEPSSDLVALAECLDPDSGPGALFRLLRRVARSPHATRRTLDQFLPGVPAELVARVPRIPMGPGLGRRSTSDDHGARRSM